MDIIIKKRSGVYEDFDVDKLTKAIGKSMKEVGTNNDAVSLVVDAVCKSLVEEIYTVDQLENLVEESLMLLGEYQAARQYILYRFKTKPDIFRKRIDAYPMEYPKYLEYISAIRGCYWTHNEFNYISDVHDLQFNMSPQEREAVIRCSLAISQVEVAGVKTFWRKVGDIFPKPEIDMMGVTFGESEVRHFDAYKHILDLLKLNGRFESIRDVPAIKARINYLEDALMSPKDNIGQFHKIILFSMFIENVSLMSQFLIIMSINKHDATLLTGFSNVVEATSKEEDIHARAGFDLVNDIKAENPSWWTPALVDTIVDKAKKAIAAEKEIIDWIFEEGEIEAISKKTVYDFVLHRMNLSLKAINIPYVFEVDDKSMHEFEWFGLELTTTKSFDRFNKRSTAYNKNKRSITGDDL
jgi:ribonucleoside-diphosphate reductase beta chain